MRKEVKTLVDEAVKQGWRSKVLSSGHVQLFSPDRRTIVTVPGTPSGPRWRDNVISQLRRGGFKWPSP